jgi:hypothetical protein
MKFFRYISEDGTVTDDIAKYKPNLGMSRRVGIGLGLGRRRNKDRDGKCPFLKFLTKQEK